MESEFEVKREEAPTGAVFWVYYRGNEIGTVTWRRQQRKLRVEHPVELPDHTRNILYEIAKFLRVP